MPNNVTPYVEYFRQLAVRHKDILHDPQTELGLGATAEQGFTTFGNNEVIQGLNTTLSKTALLLELYDVNGNSENVYDIRQNPKGAFMVVNLVEPNNFPDQMRAMALTETIVYDILKQIWQDHYGPDADQCERPFKQFKWNTEITPTGKLFTNYYGWYVQFYFDFQNTIDITQAPAVGTFINP